MGNISSSSPIDIYNKQFNMSLDVTHTYQADGEIEVGSFILRDAATNFMAGNGTYEIENKNKLTDIYRGECIVNAMYANEEKLKYNVLYIGGLDKHNDKYNNRIYPHIGIL